MERGNGFTKGCICHFSTRWVPSPRIPPQIEPRGEHYCPIDGERESDVGNPKKFWKVWRKTDSGLCPAEEMRGFTVTLHICSCKSLYVLCALLYISSFSCSAAEVSENTDVLDKKQLLELHSKCIRPVRCIDTVFDYRNERI